MDKIIFNGNVGKDAEYTEKDGRGMAKFTVAVTHKVKGEKVTEWRNVTAFGKLAEICRDWVKKGRAVIVEGRPGAHAYKNKLEELVASIDVTADNVEFVGSARDAGGGTAPNPAGAVVVPDDGEMPF